MVRPAAMQGTLHGKQIGPAMPRQTRRAIISGLSALLLPASQPAQLTIRLARLGEFPDQIVGGEILSVVYGRLGIAVEFVDVPAKRALMLSSSGELDGEVQRIAGIQRDYPTLLQISPPINYIEPAAFTTGLRFEVRGWQSIRNYRIGIVRGVGSSEDGTRGMQSVVAANNLDSLVRMLDAGRFDVLVTDLFSGSIAVKKLNLASRIRPLTPPLQQISIYHYLNERHRDLAEKVAAVLRDMEASGELAQLRTMFRRQLLETS